MITLSVTHAVRVTHPAKARVYGDNIHVCKHRQQETNTDVNMFMSVLMFIFKLVEGYGSCKLYCLSLHCFRRLCYTALQ